MEGVAQWEAEGDLYEVETSSDDEKKRTFLRGGKFHFFSLEIRLICQKERREKSLPLERFLSVSYLRRGSASGAGRTVYSVR